MIPWLFGAGLLACTAAASAAPPPPADTSPDFPLAWFLPWAERPPHIHWMISVGPAVSFFTEPPAGAANVFVGLRLGIGLASRGQHHVSADDPSFGSTLGRNSYFRSGIPFVPDNIFISPMRAIAGEQSGLMDVYGLSVRLVSIGLHPVGDVVRFGCSGGIIGTYAAITAGEQTTDFLRPGLDLRADVELDWNGPWFVSAGWNSLFHLPQDWGAAPDRARPGAPALWHIGQAFLLFTMRVGDEG